MYNHWSENILPVCWSAAPFRRYLISPYQPMWSIGWRCVVGERHRNYYIYLLNCCWCCGGREIDLHSPWLRSSKQSIIIYLCLVQVSRVSVANNGWSITHTSTKSLYYYNHRYIYQRRICTRIRFVIRYDLGRDTVK